MIKKATIPVLFPLQPKELTVQLTVANGVITFIQVLIGVRWINFIREANGTFKTVDLESDRRYLNYIERQLTRMYS